LKRASLLLRALKTPLEAVGIGSLFSTPLQYQCRDPIEVGPFRIRFDACQANQDLQQADDSRAEILIVARGWATQVLDTGSQECAPLSVSYRPPAYPKRDRIGEAGLLAVRIDVSAAFAHQVDKDYFLGEERPRHYHFAALDRVPALILGECYGANVASPLLLDGLLRQLIAKAARLSAALDSFSPLPKWLERAVELMEESYRDPLRIDDIARMVGITQGHFSRLFCYYLGVSAKQYIRALRLKEGARLLTTTSIPVSEIAAQLSFFDQSHFTRAFYRWFGESPLAFRRRQ
jgi:AraC-like DNA-binding protein